MRSRCAQSTMTERVFHLSLSYLQLALRHNRLRYIPKELTRLAHLTEIHIQQNQINVLPPAIGRQTSGASSTDPMRLSIR